jgi:transposase-like protein
MSLEREFKRGLTVVGLARKHGLTRQQVEARLRQILRAQRGWPSGPNRTLAVWRKRAP